MNNNLIPAIAKMLGVEVGEEFIVKRSNSSARVNYFSSTQLLNKEEGSAPAALVYLLNGTLEITKLPWKPKTGEKYWSYSADIGSVTWYVWGDRFLDKLRFKNNIVFATKEKAEEKVKSIDSWLERENDACI